MLVTTYKDMCFHKAEGHSLDFQTCENVSCRLLYCVIVSCGLGSSVGIVTDYGPDCPGSNPGGDEILHQPPVKWVLSLSLA